MSRIPFNLGTCAKHFIQKALSNYVIARNKLGKIQNYCAVDIMQDKWKDKLSSSAAYGTGILKRQIYSPNCVNYISITDSLDISFFRRLLKWSLTTEM